MLRYVDAVCKSDDCASISEVSVELAEGECIPEEVECPHCHGPAIVTLGGKPRAWRGVPKTARDEHTGR
jgi:hypothetical protein